MSWDHPVHSFNYPTGEPQTPTRTPPTTFGDSAFQTPKLESSFFDPRVTWDTSDPYASSPEFLRTPQRFGLTTPSNPLRIPDTAPDRNAVIDSSNLKSAKASDQTDTARRIRASKPNGGSAEEGLRTVDSAKSAASMQTPPPSSASRRKVMGLENVNDTARRASTPGAVGGHLETPSRLMGASPRLFGNIESSPDLFQLGSIDPSASPFFPQQKLFWGQDNEQHASNSSMPASNMNLFDANPNDVFGTHHNSISDAHIPQLPSIEGTMDLPEFHNNAFGLTAAAATDAALFPAPFSTSPRLRLPKAEDPAMFLSSPARRFGGIQPSPDQKLFSRPTRQPYHHQMEEFKREEIRRSQSVNQQLPFDDDDDDDDFTPRRLRPGLTRSVTHSALNRPPPLQPSGMMTSTSGIRKSPSKGRLSPVKSLRPSLSRSNSVATGLPSRSPSVVLKIGKDGRAKAEMQPLPEASTGLTDPITGMDLDGSATESEYDSAEFPVFPTVPSRKPSMVFSDAGRPMLARSDSGSRPVSKGSYTSIASSHSGRASPWAGSTRSVRRPNYQMPMEDWHRTPTRHSSTIVNSDFSRGSARSVSAAALPDPPEDEDTGDAQHALRQVIRERSRKAPHTIGYGPRYSHSSRSLAHLRSSPPRFGAELDIRPREPNTSPTTMTDPDLATPSTERFSNPSIGTRCVCNSMDNGGHLMIQCESCNHWLHTKCVGLERSHLPSVYVCMFCAQTPTRTNRSRGGLGGVSHAPTSPLAHKSFRLR